MKNKSSIFSILILALGWHILAYFNIINSEFFPSPFSVLSRMIVLLGENSFSVDVAHSFYRLFAATIISIPLAFLFALLCSHYSWIDRFFNPIIAFTYPLPKVAIIPLLMLIFGIGNLSKVIIISLGMFYLLFIQLRHSMIHLKTSALGAPVKIYGITGKNYLLQIIFKGVLLDFFKAIKIAFSYGLTLVVVSEFSMSQNGIGNFIWKSWDQFRIIEMYAGVYFLCLTGFAIYFVLDSFIIKTSSKYHF